MSELFTHNEDQKEFLRIHVDDVPRLQPGVLLQVWRHWKEGDERCWVEVRYLGPSAHRGFLEVRYNNTEPWHFRLAELRHTLASQLMLTKNEPVEAHNGE